MVAGKNKKSTRQINLLFLIYDLERGGPELRLLDMQKCMPDDFKIDICVTSQNTALMSDFVKAGGRICIVPVKRGYFEINKAWSIYRKYKKKTISIINVYGLRELFQGACIRLFSGFRIRIVYHAVGTFDHFKIHHKIAFRLLAKTACCILCNSIHLERQLRALLIAGGKIKRINNGVDAGLFDRHQCTQRDEIGLSKDKKGIIIGTIANFRKEKNYPFLIKAFSELREKYSNLCLVCVGGGPLIEEIKQLAEELRMQEHIVFTGYSDDIIDHLCLMDFFVLCSERESFPNVLLQAMSMEVPVVTSDAGGCVEIITHGKNGIIFPINDQKAFIKRLETLIENRSFAEKLAENGRKTIVEKFSIERMINNYAGFYRDLSDH